MQSRDAGICRKGDVCFRRPPEGHPVLRDCDDPRRRPSPRLEVSVHQVADRTRGPLFEEGKDPLVRVTRPPRERFLENLDSFMLKCMTNTLSAGHSPSSRLPVLRIFKLIGTAVAVVTGASFDRIVKRHSDFESLLAHRVRLAFEHLGPTFVKAGQLLSSSAGPLPQAWMDEMAHCRDDVAAAPWKAACELLAGELGNKMDQILDMDHEPIAAGSMAQVYGARLANGDAVVVKVQRPGLERVLSKDIRILRTAARLAIRFSPSCAAANPKALVEEFASGLAQQLSFRREADNADAMRAHPVDLGRPSPECVPRPRRLTACS